VLFVDGRAGSKELIEPLSKMGLPVEEITLDFGDIYFEGRGEKGASLSIGIEHKKISDLVQSLTSGRLQGHQLPGMHNTYDRSWLIIEGDWQHDAQGRVTVWKGKGTRKPLRGAGDAVDLEKRILCLETRGGIRTRICPTRRDTLRFLCALYRFWTDKALDEHRSHLALHAPDLDRGLRIPISDFRAAVAQFPGVGYETSAVMEREFDSDFDRMMFATVEHLAEIKIGSKRFGASRAKVLYEFLHPKRRR
jgi:hypothetical protein